MVLLILLLVTEPFSVPAWTRALPCANLSAQKWTCQSAQLEVVGFPPRSPRPCSSVCAPFTSPVSALEGGGWFDGVWVLSWSLAHQMSTKSVPPAYGVSCVWAPGSAHAQPLEC